MTTANMGTRRQRWTDGRWGPIIVALLLLGVVVVVFGSSAIRFNGSEYAEERATLQTMKTIDAALKAYRVDQGNYPPSLQSLVTAKLMEDHFDDVWKTPIGYQAPGLSGEDYTLVSAGPDRQPGTEDDLDVRRATGRR